MAENEYKNPLAHMLGAYFRRERNLLKLSSRDAARKLDVSDSVYRMFESGGTSIQPYRIFAIIKLFYNSKIEFDRLSKFVSAIHYIDYLVSEGKTPKAALYQLSELDDDFEHFYKRTEGYFDGINTGDGEFKELLESNIANEVEAFLAGRNPSRASENFFNDTIIEEILNMPTLNLQLYLDFMKTLKDHPPLHIGDIAQTWEEKNKSKFKSLIGLYKKPEIIISQENFKKFNYPYLFENGFTEIRMLLLENGEKKYTKKNFIDELNKARKELRLLPLSEKEENKIQVATLAYKPNKDEIETILSDGNSLYSGLAAFWQFTMKDKNTIGFIGSKEHNNSYVINLTYKETMRRADMFEKLWNKTNK